LLKISPEERLNAVKRHFAGGESHKQIADSLAIGASTVRDWCHIYEIYGDTAFIKSGNNKYSLELKAEAVQYYLSGQGSLQETCKVFNIRSKYQLQNWIMLYNSCELKASPGGNKKVMTKGRKTSFEERIEIVEHCIKEGCNYNKTAEKYKVSYNQVYQWVGKYKKNGIDGLTDRRGRTKPADEMSELEKIKYENKILKAQLERKELENIFLKKLKEIEGRRY